MSKNHRLFVPGGTFFFTVNLRDRRSDLLVRRIALGLQCTLRRWPR